MQFRPGLTRGYDKKGRFNAVSPIVLLPSCNTRGTIEMASIEVLIPERSRLDFVCDPVNIVKRPVETIETAIQGYFHASSCSCAARDCRFHAGRFGCRHAGEGGESGACTNV